MRLPVTELIMRIVVHTFIQHVTAYNIMTLRLC